MLGSRSGEEFRSEKQGTVGDEGTDRELPEFDIHQLPCVEHRSRTSSQVKSPRLNLTIPHNNPELQRATQITFTKRNTMVLHLPTAPSHHYRHGLRLPSLVVILPVGRSSA